MKKKIWVVMALLLPMLNIGVTLNGFNVQNAMAEESDTKLAIEDDGMTHVGISPYDIHLDLSPGSNYVQSFKVLNYGAKSIDYNIQISPYNVSSEDYNPVFDEESSSTQITKWITLSKDSGTLAGGELEEVSYRIDVPEDVPYGGQYAAIMVSATDQPDENSGDGFQIAMNVGVAYIVYGSITDGETRVEATVEENSIAPVVLDGDIAAKSLVKNSGNTHVVATYVLQVFPLFSDEEIYTNEENPIERTILPGTSRLSTTEWQETPMIGIFKAVHTITIGGESFSQETLVVKCPIWLIAIVLGVIFVIIFVIVYSVRKKKAQKKAKEEKKEPTGVETPKTTE